MYSQKRPYGIHPDAWEAYLEAGVPLSRIGQCIGYAVASAGTHAPDGLADGQPYCAATDLHVSDLGFEEVRALLSRLADWGFAAFFRRPGFDHWPTYDALHVHAIYAGVKMKPALQRQVHGWLHGQNGLASQARYEFWQPTPAQCQIVRALFLAHNPAEVCE